MCGLTLLYEEHEVLSALNVETVKQFILWDLLDVTIQQLFYTLCVLIVSINGQLQMSKTNFKYQ